MARTPKVIEDRREQILNAAVRVFARKGFERATNKDIAEEAGITAGLIYHYFASKEMLLKAAIDAFSPVGLIRQFPAELLQETADHFLHFLAHQLLIEIEDERFIQLLRLFLPAAIYDTNQPAFNLPAIQEVNGFLESQLILRMKAGELRQVDASLAAQFFTGSLMAFVIRRQLLREPVALQYTQAQVADHVVDLILHGILSAK